MAKKTVINPCAHSAIAGLESTGECCCNCQYQQPITAHPWNENPLVKGSVTKTVGWGCTCPEFFPDIGFMEREHSLCECWRQNTYRKELADADLQREKEWVWNILARESKNV